MPLHTLPTIFKFPISKKSLTAFRSQGFPHLIFPKRFWAMLSALVHPNQMDQLAHSRSCTPPVSGRYTWRNHTGSPSTFPLPPECNCRQYKPDAPRSFLCYMHLGWTHKQLLLNPVIPSPFSMLLFHVCLTLPEEHVMTMPLYHPESSLDSSAEHFLRFTQ